MTRYNVGVALAGAISAGAYSGGVFDFLVEALEEYEKSRQPSEGQVVLAAFSGASAGSITAALGILSAVGRADNTPYRLQELYDAWVVKPDLTNPGGGVDKLLSLGDLAADDAKVYSLLNGDPLDQIADSAIAGPVGTARPYLADRLHLYMTHSNLRGVPYTVAFNGVVQSGYGMMCHADRAHYLITNAGTAPFTSAWAAPDPFHPLNLAQRPATPAAVVNQWAAFRTATLGSAAFPLGLPARLIDDNTTADCANRMFPSVTANITIQPDWPKDWTNLFTAGSNPRYPYVTVDGGALNNHPFEYVRRVVESGTVADEKSTVLMINPFPEPPTFQSDDKDARDRLLMTVIKRIIPMFIDQNRFKIEELAEALDNNRETRWLIAPVRYMANGTREPDAIACGLLGGFGGFIDRSFREHDYQLGRRNCQDFLNGWFSAVTGVGPVMPQNPALLPPNQRPGTVYPAMNALIPLRGSAAIQVVMPPWPRIGTPDLDRVIDAVMVRAGKLVPMVIDSQISSAVFRWVLKRGWNWFGTGMLKSFVHDVILADLVRRDQIVLQINGAPLPLTNIETRRVLAACIEPAYDWRTAEAIGRDVHLSTSVVERELASLSGANAVARYTGSGGPPAPAYTYIDRVPSLWDRITKTTVFDT